MKHGVTTYTGAFYEFLKPEKHKWDIEAIAHSLSLQTRWNGNCKTFYSIAEHCYHCSFLVPPQFALSAHLHDAVESVTGDCSTTLKALLPLFKEIEIAGEKSLCKQFKIPFPFPSEVKDADNIMLETERRDLMPKGKWIPKKGVIPLKKTLKPWGPAKAKRKFLERFYQLTENK